ncbi:MAG TPA: lysylphosphatidylglycerol synthase transmembrane domain-containing protein [Anaerolineales bacterium]|nr:lysylphosphatidylglycerol synthase transmembrane domain-containing protein [Anaerolineales bacterium]
MRKFLVAVVIFLGVVFLITNFAQVEAIVDTLKRGDWRFLGLALLVQGAWLVNVAASYRAIYRALGIYEPLERLFLIAAAASFINVVTPSGVVGGVTLFAAQAKQRGYSPIRATLAGVIYLLFEYAAILCVVAVGLVVLFRRNDLTGAEIFATGIVILLAVILATLLGLGMRSENALNGALTAGARTINKILRPILRRDYLSEQRAHEFAHDAASGLIELREDFRKDPKTLAWPFALALSNRALLLTVFFLMFMAFKTPFSPGTIIAGFAIGYLFLIVSPTPAGIGVVEGILTVTLRSLNVPLGSAAVITLAYRGFTFWLPLLIGMVALRILERKSITAVAIKE